MWIRASHLTVSEQLKSDLDSKQFPGSVLFSGPQGSGKLTAALETARILSCTETPHAMWNCSCPSCLQHKALVSGNLILTGPRDCTPEIAAARELREETGLTLLSIEDKLYDSYSAIGFSNETNAVVIGKASGEFAPSTSTLEEIEAAWYTKKQVKELLKNNHFAARTQAYCYMWSKN